MGRPSQGPQGPALLASLRPRLLDGARRQAGCEALATVSGSFPGGSPCSSPRAAPCAELGRLSHSCLCQTSPVRGQALLSGQHLAHRARAPQVWRGYRVSPPGEPQAEALARHRTPTTGLLACAVGLGAWGTSPAPGTPGRAGRPRPGPDTAGGTWQRLRQPRFQDPTPVGGSVGLPWGLMDTHTLLRVAEGSCLPQGSELSLGGPGSTGRGRSSGPLRSPCRPRPPPAHPESRWGEGCLGKGQPPPGSPWLALGLCSALGLSPSPAPVEVSAASCRELGSRAPRRRACPPARRRDLLGKPPPWGSDSVLLVSSNKTSSRRSWRCCGGSKCPTR